MCRAWGLATMALLVMKTGIMLHLSPGSLFEVRSVSTVTVSSQYVRRLLEGAELKGYSAEDILKTRGIPPQILTSSKLRISTLAFAKLMYAVIELLRDETVGQLRKPQPIGSLRLLVQACSTRRTVRESFQTWRDGLNLIGGGVKTYWSEIEGGGYYAVHCESAPGIADDFATETGLMVAHRVHCWLAQEFLPIRKVELKYPEPAHSDEYRFLFYGAPVHFGQRQNAIFFDDKTLDLECHRDRDSLDEILKQIHIKMMMLSRQGTSLTMQIRLWLERCFREGLDTAQLPQAAEHFGLNPQTLRRQLKAQGASYQQLKEDTRRDVAIHYINEGQLSIEEIGFRLGYSESSTFIRAFKGWTGLTPLSFRKL